MEQALAACQYFVATQAVLCTDLTADPLQVVSWFTLRWQLEVTFRAVHAYLGVETQRQWSERAIASTTPALLGLFSLVTLLTHDLVRTGSALPCRQSAWYCEPEPTFAGALALVRRHLWAHTTFPHLPCGCRSRQSPRALVEH